MRQRNMLLVVALLLLACATATAPRASMDQAVDQVRQAEIDFAKAFSDQHEAQFASMIDEGAYFLGPRRTLHGKTEIMQVWSGLIRDNQFSWEPERVVVNSDATLGLSTGPVRDRSGKVIGQYSSIWQRRPDGSWKVVFDGPGSSCPQP